MCGVRQVGVGRIWQLLFLEIRLIISGQKKFDQLKPKQVLGHVQKSPKMHANLLITLFKASELCNLSPW